MSQQSVVTLQIAGEEYTIRAHATPEHARACAAHVDAAVREVQQALSLGKGAGLLDVGSRGKEEHLGADLFGL